MDRDSLSSVSRGLMFASLLLPAAAMGAEARFNAAVVRTLAAEDSLYGGCMARLSVPPHTEGLDCSTQPWVTLDCDVSKAAAQRMFDTAQVATSPAGRWRSSWTTRASTGTSVSGGV